MALYPIQKNNIVSNSPLRGLYGTAKKSTTNLAKGTSQDFYNVAVQNGLKADADRILAQKGEENKKIFSGGFFSDIFDALNALQYGVVGVLKGKGFVEGVKTRQSWSDQDALGDLGLPGVIGGIALDIASDPLTYIAPWTILKKIPGVAKGVSAISKAAFGTKVIRAVGTGEKITDVADAVKKGVRIFEDVEDGTKAGKWLARKFQYMFGADPVFKNVLERSGVAKIKGVQNLAEMTKGIIDLPKEKMAQLLTKDKTGRFMRKSLDELKGVLTDDELFKVAKSYAILDDLGKEAVEVGLLKKGTWEENVGEYIKNAYTEFEQSKGKGMFSYLKEKIAGIKPRVKGLTPERMKELGQIDNPAYLMLKSTVDLYKDVENAKLFKIVADSFGSDKWVEGMAKKALPDGKSWGALAGKYVPEFMSDYLTELTRMKSPTEKALNKIVGGFKYGKVILNPATHARNVMSNMILNWWKLGIAPWRMDLYGEALGEIAKGSGKWIDEAKTVGYNIDTFAANELKDLLLSPDSSKAIGKIKGLGKKIADIYQGEENFAKLTAFIAKRKAGLGIEDAWKAAEAATFNYAQVTPFVRRMRESLFGFPFITFTVKSTPIVAETALKAPGRISVFGKIKSAIENQAGIEETAKERASEPQWIKDGFFIKLPIKDKFGRSAYFDLTYIIPFGDLISGNFFDKQVSRETGLAEGLPQALARKSPFFNLIKEITSNQDFYGDKIWNDSATTDKQLGDLFRHVTKTYLPPNIADQIPGGHIQTGENAGKRRQKGILPTLGLTQDKADQQRTLMEEMLRNVGAKIQPIDQDLQETYMELEKKKALRTLLQEKGIIADYSIPYIPKK